jgi:hypothetical protein
MIAYLYHKDNTVFEFSKFIENIFWGYIPIASMAALVSSCNFLLLKIK